MLKRERIKIDNIEYIIIWHSEDFIKNEIRKLLSDGKDLFMFYSDAEKVIKEEGEYKYASLKPVGKYHLQKITNGIQELIF